MVSVNEVRKKYINFFKEKNHVEIFPAPLVPKDDPTTLFTPFGMQPLVPYLMGKPHPMGKRLVNSQPAIRLEDMNEVGDTRHTTFFEMLGNWSLGDYFKKEQILYFFDFLTKELKLPKDRLYFTFFEGSSVVPRDTETENILKQLGINSDHIVSYGVEKNWWSRCGTPEQMEVGEIGGPDSEVFYDFGTEHNKNYGEKCHPNCDCGRFMEIGNSVFIEYIKEKDNSLNNLEQKNVDFGGGLERLTAAVNNLSDIFKIDVFYKAIGEIELVTNLKYGQSEQTDKSFRVIADHTRASAMLISSGVIPGNKLQGYALRRLIRRAVFHSYLLTNHMDKDIFPNIVRGFFSTCNTIKENYKNISSILKEEENKFEKVINKGFNKLDKSISKGIKINGKFIFDLYQSEGFPPELTFEILQREGVKLDSKEKKVLSEEFNKHKELSKTASAGLFKGGLTENTEETKKLHTATHLLHTALRKILGESVTQRGSNINRERLRFDFSFNRKLTDVELSQVEDLVNKIISEGLTVQCKEMSLKDAQKLGALAFFGEKYSDIVTVYQISDFSKELCAGPHVLNTKELGHFKIIKEEAVGSDVRRIKAILD